MERHGIFCLFHFKVETLQSGAKDFIKSIPSLNLNEFTMENEHLPSSEKYEKLI